LLLAAITPGCRRLPGRARLRPPRRHADARHASRSGTLHAASQLALLAPPRRRRQPMNTATADYAPLRRHFFCAFRRFRDDFRSCRRRQAAVSSAAAFVSPDFSAFIFFSSAAGCHAVASLSPQFASLRFRQPPFRRVPPPLPCHVFTPG